MIPETELAQLQFSYSLSNRDIAELRKAMTNELGRAGCGKWWGRSNNRIRDNVMAIRAKQQRHREELLKAYNAEPMTRKQAEELTLKVSALLALEYRSRIFAKANTEVEPDKIGGHN